MAHKGLIDKVTTANQDAEHSMQQEKKAGQIALKYKGTLVKMFFFVNKIEQRWKKVQLFLLPLE